jgi:HAE1 family hydrophobic/amphiphilic exporter-1
MYTPVRFSGSIFTLLIFIAFQGRGEELLQSTLEAVRLRLRPIILTSMAFILGVMPLVLATGAGAVARNTIRFTVLGGMLAFTSISIFIVPVLFVLSTRFSYGKKELAWLKAHHQELMEKEKRVEQQNIDPELEYDITHAGDPSAKSPDD